jgi:hypothetical protein
MNARPLEGLGEAPPSPARRTIPFDIAFRYQLVGERERVHRQIVTISIEATFVAVSIGYGVVPTVDVRTFGPQLSLDLLGRPNGVAAGATGNPRIGVGSVSLRNIPLGSQIDGLADTLDDRLPAGEVGPRVASVFTNGFRLNAAFASQVLADGAGTRLEPATLSSLFQVVAAPADRVQFRYALFDDATGREFQSQPILNIAGLGAANGDRPFRYFARPVAFAPRSTIRLEITEASDVPGELHVALQGYKVLGSADSPTGRRGRSRTRRLPRRMRIQGGPGRP